jgi:hypothetical protein
MKPETSPLASTLALALSWCDEDRDLLGSTARPLSLVSHHLLSIVSPQMLWIDPGYENEEGEVADLTLYDWMHTADIAEVTEWMWTGEWRSVVERAAGHIDGATLLEVLPEWRERRLRLATLCAAVEYKIIKKPPRDVSAKSTPPPQPPPEMLYPTRLARRLHLLQRETGCTRLEAKWEYPYWEAVQICHAADYHEGHWMVASGAQSAAPDFDEFQMPNEVMSHES